MLLEILLTETGATTYGVVEGLLLDISRDRYVYQLGVLEPFGIGVLWVLGEYHSLVHDHSRGHFRLGPLGWRLDGPLSTAARKELGHDVIQVRRGIVIHDASQLNGK